ncbi:MAG: SBBP repeat-containing protein [Bacteroidota bacterium]
MKCPNWCFVLFFCTFITILNAQDHQHSNAYSFVENRGQWKDDFQFKASVGEWGTLFLEQQKLTYVFVDPAKAEAYHDHLLLYPQQQNYPVNAHAYQVHFVGARGVQPQGKAARKAYHNYFLTKDTKRWAAKVPLFQEAHYQQLYDGIDLIAYAQEGQFKYDFIVAPGADPSQIIMDYQGIDHIQLDNGQLSITTSVENIYELPPHCFQMIDGTKRIVEAKYVLQGQQVSFAFPQGYNTNYDLIIDPVVVAATLAGSVLNKSFGHCGTFDFAGNAYTAARSFGIGYPVSTGAYQFNYGGGTTDIAISKYNPTGSDLIFATYIGGDGSDLPNHITTDTEQRLYLYGTSTSDNYPVSSNAFQSEYQDSTEIILSIFDVDGSSLVGSTYLGGSGPDGNNATSIFNSYGDFSRGEIAVDAQNNVYLASVSGSPDFPTSSGAFDVTFDPTGSNDSPAQDAVVLKMNSDLSELIWSTYLGAEQADAANGLRVDEVGNVYVVGTAGSSNFPVPPGGIQANWAGGDLDAFVVKIAANGASLLSGTFWGSDKDDKGVMIDLDANDQPHILGNTKGNMPITPNTYFFNQGSFQYLTGFSTDLDQLLYSTVIGNGPDSEGGIYSDADFIPVALMVDDCGSIYFSSYGAVGSLPTSNDAFSQIGNTYYFAQLTPNASELAFASYYGQADHVDGGSSSFNKAGKLYQGVCSCTGSVLNTLTNAWASSQSTQCDVGLLIVDFETNLVFASANSTTGFSGNAPFTVDFEFTGSGASTYNWDFGTGDTSTEANPSYTFTNPGTYSVRLTASHPESCNLNDTFDFTIRVFGSTSVESIGLGVPQYQINPNPLLQEQDKGTLAIQEAIAQNLDLNIYDSYGKLVSQEKIQTVPEQKEYLFDVPAMSGVYYLELLFPKGQSKSLKFVKLNH